MNALVRRLGSAPRRAWAIAGAVLVTALVALVVLGVRPGDRGGLTGTPAAATTAGASPAFTTAPPPPLSPAPTGPTATATALPPSADPVPLDAAARVGDVTVSLADVAAIQGTATGPGDVAGPALRVTVRLVNGTNDPLDLLGVAVSTTYGAGATPAPPLGDPSAAPLSGTLEPGATADGVYVFRVPTDARDSVTVSVGYQAGARYAVFTGAV